MSISSISQRDFVQVGRSMKNFCYACLLFGVVGGILYIMSVFGSLSYSFSYMPGSNSLYYNPLVLIWGEVIVVIVLAVLLLGFYIKMILDMGTVARSTSDSHLLKANNCFKWSIVVTFLGVALLVGFSILSTSMSLGNMYGFSSIYSFPMALFLSEIQIIGALIFYWIVVCLLPILGAISLNNWALGYTTGKQSQACKSIKDGSDTVKLGEILSLIIPVIGPIITIIGFWQLGNGLSSEFSGDSTPRTTRPMIPTTIPQEGTTVQARFVVPVPSSTIEVNPATQVRFCPHCGKKVEAMSARFCQSCGMPLY